MPYVGKSISYRGTGQTEDPHFLVGLVKEQKTLQGKLLQENSQSLKKAILTEQAQLPWESTTCEKDRPQWNSLLPLDFINHKYRLWKERTPRGDKKGVGHRLTDLILIQCAGWWRCRCPPRAAGGAGEGEAPSLELTFPRWFTAVNAKQFTSKRALLFCLYLNEHSSGTWNWGRSSDGRGIQDGESRQRKKSARQPVRGWRSQLAKEVRGQWSGNIFPAERLLLSQRPEVPYQCSHEPISDIFENHKTWVRYWETEDGKCHSALSKGTRKRILKINRWRRWRQCFRKVYLCSYDEMK